MTHSITNISLDNALITSYAPQIEHEYRTALADILHSNHLKLNNDNLTGPYNVHISARDNRLVFNISSEDEDIKLKNSNDANHLSLNTTVILPITPFKRLIRDYFIICESYFDALAQSSPSKLETIDMARRSVHNEGSDLLQTLLLPRAEVDTDTARRLFTLICVLHIRQVM